MREDSDVCEGQEMLRPVFWAANDTVRDVAREMLNLSLQSGKGKELVWERKTLHVVMQGQVR